MLLYLAIFLLGFLFLGVTFLVGGVFDFVGDHFSHDSDPTHALSGKTVAAGMTAFGATGMITRVYHFSTGLSVLVSFLAALAFGAFTVWLMGLMYDRTASTNVTVSSMRGRVAEVSVGIASGSVGEVLLSSIESTRHMLARSTTGEAIPAGARVRIVETHENMVVVEPETLNSTAPAVPGDQGRGSNEPGHSDSGCAGRTCCAVCPGRHRQQQHH